MASYTRGRLVQPLVTGDIHSHGSDKRPVSHPSSRAILNPVVDDDSHTRLSRAVSPDAGGSAFTAGQYSGPTSSYTFLRRAWKRFRRNDSNGQGLSQDAHVENSPSDQVSPFNFGDRLAQQSDTEDYRLPERSTAISLVHQYFDLAMPTHRFFHQQTVLLWLDAYYRQEDAEADQEVLIPVRQVSGVGT